MLDETTRLEPNQRKDIAERVLRFIEEQGLTQAAVAREAGIGKSTFNEVLRLQYAGKTSDLHLVRLHNWLELAARREDLIRKRKYVEHSVATDILHVAGIVAETCKMGVRYGPSHIGKSMTLQAIEGDQRFGDPVLFRIDETLLRECQGCGGKQHSTRILQS